MKFKLSAQLFTVWLMNIRSGLVNMKNISIIKDFFTDERERERLCVFNNDKCVQFVKIVFKTALI